MRIAAFAAAALVASASVTAGAQGFPARPVHIIVPNPPGGTVDLVTRAIAPALEALGQPVVVEPKPGGNSVIGLDSVARAAPDGHTLVMASSALVTAPLLMKLPYDGMNAFVPVVGIGSTPNVFVVHPSFPATDIGELVALAKSAPVNCATAAPASAVSLAAARFALLSQTKLNLVSYQGGVQSVHAALAGHTPVAFVPISDAAPHIASGRLRPLAVTSPERHPLLRDVPTLAESGYPGFQAVLWFGLAAPAGTPRAVVDRLSAAVLQALEKPEMRARFATLGIQPMPMGPDRFAEYLRDESGTLAEVIRSTGVKAQ